MIGLEFQTLINYYECRESQHCCRGDDPLVTYHEHELKAYHQGYRQADYLRDAKR